VYERCQRAVRTPRRLFVTRSPIGLRGAQALLFRAGRIGGVLGQSLQEFMAPLGSSNVAIKDIFERFHLAVEDSGLVLILGDSCSVKINTSEDPAGPRIGQYLGLHLPVCIGPGVPPNRPGGRGECRGDRTIGTHQPSKR